jgi:hypothetical protein
LKEIFFDLTLEDVIGDVDKLRETKFIISVKEIFSNHTEITKR